MYVLTIYRIIDDIDIEVQKVAPDEETLKAAVVSWASRYGWIDDDEGLTLDEQYEEVIGRLEGGEEDDPRVLIRKADV